MRALSPPGLFQGLPLILAVVATMTSACSSAGPTTVGGEVTMHLDANTARTIALPSGTTLPSDTSGDHPGLVVGHCGLTGESTEVALSRSADVDAGVDAGEPVSGFSWFQLTIDTPAAPYVGHVMAQYEDDVYEADCDLAGFAREGSHGVVDVELVGCTLMAPSPSGVNSVTVEASLSFDGCKIR